MAGELPDAKIVVQLDTEGALKALRDLESRIREADLQFQRFGRAGAGAGAPGAAPGQAAPPRAAAAIPVDDEEKKKKKRRGGMLAGKPQVPNIGRIVAEKELDIAAALVSLSPVGGPTLARAMKFVGKRAIPLLQFGPAFAGESFKKFRETTREGLPKALSPAVDAAFNRVEKMLEAASGHMAELDAKQKGLEGAVSSFNQLIAAQWGANILDAEGFPDAGRFGAQFMSASWDLAEMQRKKELTMRRFLYRNLGEAAPKVFKQFTGGGSQ